MPQITRTTITIAILAAFLAVFAGCSDKNPKSIFDPEEGHGTGWTNTHGAAFEADYAVCKDCHGVDLSSTGTTGGISGVSCYSASLDGTGCHGGGVIHPTGWNSPAVHGAAAIGAPMANTITGLKSCQPCHGMNYRDGIEPCDTCHTGKGTPHGWNSHDRLPHIRTDETNAKVCAECHWDYFGSLNPTPGTTPGCFNQTLCHGFKTFDWMMFVNGTSSHGFTAKQSPDAVGGGGFEYCKRCHANDFTGASASNSVSCFDCHALSPHADPWRGQGINNATHITTDQSNASVCAECHTKDATFNTAPVDGTPGCFNSTLCHAKAKQHPSYLDAALHGAAAKNTPDYIAGQGFAYCKLCHGEDLSGDSALSCKGCHTAAPHAVPWFGPTYSHNTTDDNNSTVCSQCHDLGAVPVNCGTQCH